MILAKHTTDISDKELQVAQFASTQFLYQMIQQQSEMIADLKALVVDQNESYKKLESKISELLTVSEIPTNTNVAKTYNYGEKKIIGQNNAGLEVVRCVFSINADGSVYAWRPGNTVNPPNDGSLALWSKESFRFIE